MPSLSHSRHQLRCVLGLMERGRLKQNRMCFSPVCNNRQQLFTSQWPSSWSRFLCRIPSSPRCSPHTERRNPDLLFRKEEARLYSGSRWASESPSAHRVSVQCRDGPVTRFLLSSLPVVLWPPGGPHVLLLQLPWVSVLIRKAMSFHLYVLKWGQPWGVCIRVPSLFLLKK